MAEPKHTNIYCTVCKEWIKVHDAKEFRNKGHFEGKNTHLLAPNIGKSTRRYDRAVKRDMDRQIARAEAKKRDEAAKVATMEGVE